MIPESVAQFLDVGVCAFNRPLPAPSAYPDLEDWAEFDVGARMGWVGWGMGAESPNTLRGTPWFSEGLKGGVDGFEVREFEGWD